MGVTVPSTHANQEWTEWLITAFNSTDSKHDHLLGIVMWTVWYKRNKYQHEGIRETSQGVASFALAFSKDIWRIQDFSKKRLCCWT